MPTPDQDPVTKEAAKALGIVIPEIYHDLLQPAAREVGQKLVIVAKGISIALAPLEASVWGYERVKEYLSAKVAARLANKPPQEIISPDTVIAGPVVMGMVFAAKAPHLREMYANLLACAMHSPSANKAHPSFVQIIQQLSPAEARILQEIAKLKFSILIEKRIGWEYNPRELGSLRRNFQTEWREFCAPCGVADTALADAYYNNLIRLGILVERSQTIADPDILASPTHLKTESVVTVTDYGNLFLDVCVRD